MISGKTFWGTMYMVTIYLSHFKVHWTPPLMPLMSFRLLPPEQFLIHMTLQSLSRGISWASQASHWTPFLDSVADSCLASPFSLHPSSFGFWPLVFLPLSPLTSMSLSYREVLATRLLVYMVRCASHYYCSSSFVFFVALTIISHTRPLIHFASFAAG